MVKKHILILIALGFVVLLSSCTRNSESKRNSNLSIDNFNKDKVFPEAKELTDLDKTVFLPTLETKIGKSNNAIYAASLLFAWNEIKTYIEKPIVYFENEKLKGMNESVSFIDVLKPNEYVTSIDVDGDLITAKAYFRKSLPFIEPFRKYTEPWIFDDKKVESFGFYGSRNELADILYYIDDNDFAIRLIPQDEEHEIILIMTDFEDKLSFIEELNKLNKRHEDFRNARNQDNLWKYRFMDTDQLVVPIIEFNIAHNYTDIEGSDFRTSEIKYKLLLMFQQTAFILNEKGAEVESYAEVEACVEEETELPKPKMLKFDKPFIVLLKRKESQYPYFALYVANAELMKLQP